VIFIIPLPSFCAFLFFFLEKKEILFIIRFKSYFLWMYGCYIFFVMLLIVWGVWNLYVEEYDVLKYALFIFIFNFSILLLAGFFTVHLQFSIYFLVCFALASINEIGEREPEIICKYLYPISEEFQLTSSESFDDRVMSSNIHLDQSSNNTSTNIHSYTNVYQLVDISKTIPLEVDVFDLHIRYSTAVVLMGKILI